MDVAIPQEYKLQEFSNGWNTTTGCISLFYFAHKQGDANFVKRKKSLLNNRVPDVL
jgi:hypothetical protein